MLNKNEESPYSSDGDGDSDMAVKTKRKVLVGLLSLALAVGAWAQSITITSPSSAVAYPDGEDFASRVLGWQWNMDRLRDIAYDAGYNQPSVANGEWYSTVRSSSPAYFFPLSPGFLSAHSFVPTYYSDGTPYGPLNPIDTRKYKRLSFRSALQQAHRSFVQIGWTTDPNTWPSSTSPTGVVGRYSFEDGDPTFTAGMSAIVVKNSSGYRLYDLDLYDDTWDDGRVPWLVLSPAKFLAPWGYSRNVYGLMLWLSTSAPVGSGALVDWIRLYDPNSSPELEIKWQTAGFTWDSWHSIRIFIDTDSSGYDGDLFVTGLDNTGSHTIKTAALPPGDYWVYLQVVRHENSGFRVVATSSYSERIHIGNAPVIEFTAPSYTSGADYATTELGNPWNFNNASDVTLAQEISNIQYVGGVMDAYANAPLPGQQYTDARIQLNMKKNGVLVPINPQRYRYLTYRMKSDIGNTTILDRTGKWVVKLIWWNQSLTKDGTYTREFQQLEDYRNYYIDLWDRNLSNPLYTYTNGWQTLPQISYFRFDPLETPGACRFWLDDIKLCAVNSPTNNQYTIQWNLSDLDSAEVTVKLFYGYYTALGYQEYPTPLAVVTQAPGTGSFVWDMSTIANDDYYIRGEVYDGAHSNSWMSKVPISVTGSYPRMNVLGDDPTVFQRGTGNWKIAFAGENTVGNYQWGWNNVEAVPGDYDGDGTNDLAIFNQSDGRWYIRKVNGDIIAWEVYWGWPGVRPVSGDYDGDGKSDLAIFDQNTGRWFIQTVDRKQIAWSTNWGWPGVEPVSGDYNGDGKSDLAIFDQNTGRWFIRELTGGVIAWQMFWGWPGVRPVTGDYDGDGTDDLAIFDQNTGRWFIETVNQQILVWEQWWGFAGCTPVSGDYDDDGTSDRVVYYEPSGTWYFNLSGGGTDIVGPWGGTGWSPVSGNYDGK